MTLLRSVSSLWLAAVVAVSAADAPKVLPIGSPAPDFSLPGIDGKTHTLAEYSSSKVLAVIFTCNHCPDSVAAAGRTETLYQTFKDKGVSVVAVNSNNEIGLRPDELGYSPYGDSEAEMKPFAKDHGWTLPYLYDGATQGFAIACGAQSTPHVFVFDADRKLRYTGRMDDAGRSKAPVEKSYVVDAINSLLAGQEVKEPVTRSLGCSTKWLTKKDAVAADQAAWEARPVTVADLDAEIAKKLRSNTSKNVRLINFWSTTCGPCVAEFPTLVDTARRFETRGFEFISVSFDPKEDRSKVEKFLTSRHAAVVKENEKSLQDEGRTTGNYHWTGGNPDKCAEAIDSEWTGALPHSILVTPGGKIVWRQSGEVDAVELRRQILKALES
ncbi:redoxin family protein [Luteolibacter sp. LG18]|uniref:redoxin family protein n=1 Tax=Luteolibacter sp. LG18 TaxID=2819286 RepID=UPI0030C6EDFF